MVLSRWFGRSLTDVLHETREVRVKGVRFTIRKLQVSDHIEGLRTLIKNFATYEEKRASEAIKKDVNLVEVKGIYKDIFLAAVVHPHLCRNQGEQGQWVDELFVDWDLCYGLYAAIMDFTNGKKKRIYRSSRNRASLK